MADLNIAQVNHATNSPMFEKASIAVRICAFLIDHVTILVVLGAPTILFMLRDVERSPGRVFPAFQLILLAVLIIYGLRDIVGGHSIGKYLLGLAVRDQGNEFETPSILRLFGRNIFMFLWPVELLVLACSRQKTKMGDKITGTNVYRVSSKPKTIAIVATAILVVAIYVGSVTFGTQVFLRNSRSYEVAISFIETNPEIINAVGNIEGFGSRPTGGINTTGGYGQANFVIRVIGNDDNIYARIQLVRLPGRDWEVVFFDYIR